MSKLRVLELFGGIGACSKALERLGVDYEIADYVEIDKYAVKSFNAIHNTNFEPQDICEWNKDIEVDLIMHGSPCQSFSLGGKQDGGDKGSGTRSSLMWETVRIVEKLKPKYVIWENVKNLLSKKHRHNFDAYLETMEQLGYRNYYQVLNAKDYGIPQNRERVFTISIKNEVNNEFVFPEKHKETKKLKEFLTIENYCDYKIKTFLEFTNFYTIPRGSDGKLINGSYNRVWKKENYIGTINLTKIIEIAEKVDNTLLIKKITPKESWKLMGFDDEDFEKAAQVNSNTQLYKQAGNSIVVNVLEAILTNLLLEPVTTNQETIEGQTTIFDYIGDSNE